MTGASQPSKGRSKADLSAIPGSIPAHRLLVCGVGTLGIALSAVSLAVILPEVMAGDH